MTLKCLLAFHDWKENCERCSKCGKTRKDSHEWQGCKCQKCGEIRDHDWNTLGAQKTKTKKCHRCGKLEFYDYKDYLMATYDDLIPKRSITTPFGDKLLIREIDEFLLDAGESQRQRLMEEYEQERSKYESLQS